MAGSVLSKISKDEVERVRLASEYKNALDIQSKLVSAKREGRREGLQQGHKEGRQEGLQQGHKEGRWEEKRENAKKIKDGGLSISQISSFTGLTPQEIENL